MGVRRGQERRVVLHANRAGVIRHVAIRQWCEGSACERRASLPPGVAGADIMAGDPEGARSPGTPAPSQLAMLLELEKYEPWAR